jgi:hypothetical protein
MADRPPQDLKSPCPDPQPRQNQEYRKSPRGSTTCCEDRRNRSERRRLRVPSARLKRPGPRVGQAGARALPSRRGVHVVPPALGQYIGPAWSCFALTDKCSASLQARRASRGLFLNLDKNASKPVTTPSGKGRTPCEVRPGSADGLPVLTTNRGPGLSASQERMIRAPAPRIFETKRRRQHAKSLTSRAHIACNEILQAQGCFGWGPPGISRG